MKTKIKKIKSAKNINDRISGVGDFQATFPHPVTGERVVEVYKNLHRDEVDCVIADRVKELGRNPDAG